jgi:hypothetical protein
MPFKATDLFPYTVRVGADNWHGLIVAPAFQFPYIALSLAALRRKICCCHFARPYRSGFRSRVARSAECALAARRLDLWLAPVETTGMQNAHKNAHSPRDQGASRKGIRDAQIAFCRTAGRTRKHRGRSTFVLTALFSTRGGENGTGRKEIRKGTMYRAPTGKEKHGGRRMNLTLPGPVVSCPYEE